MKRVTGYGRGTWVCTPKDFLDLGSREAVDQALSRLVKGGRLRRVGHGLYDMPRISNVLKQPAPADLNAAVAALVRRDGVRVMPDGLVAANQLRLTNAVPAKLSYFTDGPSRTLKLDGRTVRFRHAGPSVMQWAGRARRSSGSSLEVDWPGRRHGRASRCDLDSPAPRPCKARSIAKRSRPAWLGVTDRPSHRGSPG